jgi:AcrR family transcriptional regulator
MSRKYRLGRRGEAAEETRRRIVEATFALHAEQGIAATSMKQIAERAKVSVGTVYHHFPSYDEAIAACGRFTREVVPPPDTSIFAGAATRAERIRRLAHAYFDLYRRVPNFEGVRGEAHKFAPLRAHFAEEARRMRALAAEALGADAEESRIAVVMALLDVAVFRTLAAEGASVVDAAQRIARILNTWLDREPPAAGGAASTPTSIAATGD